MRIELAKLLLQQPDVLLLDEPTNHLDMRSKDILKNALLEFDGTVIIASHDREFLDGLVDKVYEFGNKRIREHLGGIYDFLEYKKIESLRELERKTPAINTQNNLTTGNAVTQSNPLRNIEADTIELSSAKQSYEEQKEQARRIRKLEKAVTEAEEKITALELEIEALESQMLIPENAADASIYTTHDRLKNELTEAMNEWETATEALEKEK